MYHSLSTYTTYSSRYTYDLSYILSTATWSCPRKKDTKDIVDVAGLRRAATTFSGDNK